MLSIIESASFQDAKTSRGKSPLDATESIPLDAKGEVQPQIQGLFLTMLLLSIVHHLHPLALTLAAHRSTSRPLQATQIGNLLLPSNPVSVEANSEPIAPYKSRNSPFHPPAFIRTTPSMLLAWRPTQGGPTNSSGPTNISVRNTSKSTLPFLSATLAPELHAFQPRTKARRVAPQEPNNIAVSHRDAIFAPLEPKKRGVAFADPVASVLATPEGATPTPSEGADQVASEGVSPTPPVKTNGYRAKSKSQRHPFWRPPWPKAEPFHGVAQVASEGVSPTPPTMPPEILQPILTRRSRRVPKPIKFVVAIAATNDNLATFAYHQNEDSTSCSQDTVPGMHPIRFAQLSPSRQDTKGLPRYDFSQLSQTSQGLPRYDFERLRMMLLGWYTLTHTLIIAREGVYAHKSAYVRQTVKLSLLMSSSKTEPNPVIANTTANRNERKSS
jgi:hypothetical protein